MKLYVGYTSIRIEIYNHDEYAKIRMRLEKHMSLESIKYPKTYYHKGVLKFVLGLFSLTFNSNH